MTREEYEKVLIDRINGNSGATPATMPKLPTETAAQGQLDEQEIIRRINSSGPVGNAAQTIAASIPSPVKKAGGHALDFLAQFSRPFHAMYGGITGAARTDPGESAWRGIKEGWSLREPYNALDMVEALTSGTSMRKRVEQAVQRGEISVEDANNWLSKYNLAHDIIGIGSPDPVMFVGKIGKIPAVAKQIHKVVDPISGSAVGRTLFTKAGGSYKEFDMVADKLRSSAGYESQKAMQDLSSESNRINQLLKLENMTPEQAKAFREGDLFRALEMTEERSRLLPGQTADIPEWLQPMRDEMRRLQLENDALKESVGLIPEGIINQPGMEYMPRPSKGEATFRSMPWLNTREAIKRRHRKLFKYLDESGDEALDASGKPYRGSVEHKRSPLRMTDEGIKSKEGDISYQAYHIPKDEAEAIPGVGKRFVDDPITAMTIKWQRDINQNHFLKFLDQGLGDKIPVDNYGRPLSPSKIIEFEGKRISKDTGKEIKMGRAGGSWLKQIPIAEDVPDGWRRVKVSGLEGLAAPKPVANRIDALGKAYIDPDTWVGSVEKFLDVLFNETKIGSMAKAYRTTWARNMLALHPGYTSRNIVSNISLMLAQGTDNPMRLIDASKVQMKKGRDVIRGLSNAQLYEDYARHGLIGPSGSSWSASEMVSDAERALRPSPMEALGQRGGVIGRMIYEGSDLMRRANDWGFRANSWFEDMSKLTVAIDHTKKAIRQGKTLDEAIYLGAKAGKEAMHDYGDLPPFIAQLKNVRPFIAWEYNMLRKTIKDVGERPEKLGRLDRIYSTLLDPLQGRDLADEWMKDQVPIQGVGPFKFGKNEEGKQMMALAGSYLPHSTVEQYYRDIKRNVIPWDTIRQGWLPLVKATGEVPRNEQSFNRQAIDPTVSVGAGLINPLIGRWTGGNWFKKQERFGAPLPSAWEYFGKMFPTTRYVDEADAFFELLKPDPYRSPMSPSATAASYVFGGKVWPFDEDVAKAKRIREKQGKVGQKGMAGLYYAYNRARLANDQNAMKRYWKHILETQAEIQRIGSHTEGVQ